MNAYYYDLNTLRPTGEYIKRQVCPRSGVLLQPVHSLPVPPPVHHRAIVIRAQAGAWVVDLEASRAAALAEVDRLHAAALLALTGRATPEERDTWAVKVLAARAVLADQPTESQAQMIALEAVGRGVTPRQLAEVILGNATKYEVAVGRAGAMRQKGRAAISTAQGVTDMEAALRGAESEARALMGDVGLPRAVQSPVDAL